jgi:hypothetical protein
MLYGKSSDPVEHGLGGDPEEKRDAVHGHATQVEKHGIDLRFEGLAARSGAGKLVATRLTALLGLAGGGAIIDDPITLAFGALVHLCILQWELPYRPLEEYRSVPMKTAPLLSGLSNKFLYLSIVSVEFNSCIILGEFPVHRFALLIASGGPCQDLLAQQLTLWEPSV